MLARIVASASLLFLALVAPAQQPAVLPFEEDIRKFEAQDAITPPEKGGIVFVGSSSIRLWTTLKEDFPGRNVINRGFGGSQMSDSVNFADRIVTPYAPTTIVVFAGTNDLASGKTPETVANDFHAFVDKVRVRLPDARIIYISVTPAPSRWSKLEEVKKTNTLIKDYAKKTKKVKFLDVFDQMVTADKGPRPELFVQDQLHMNPQGYAIWTKALAPLLPKPAGR